ncbi:MAG: transglycosylase domain-containing protein, partial [Oscillospiraceae bacterium]|nr:transglycosylase domain-containing protein [Oscillospiraceae bacterium]
MNNFSNNNRNNNNRGVNTGNTDNITKRKKKKPSKAKNIVRIIFLVNFKIFSYIINIVLTVLLVAIITGGIVAGAFAIYITHYIDPSIDDLTTAAASADQTTILYYHDPNVTSNDGYVEMDTLHGGQNSFWAKYADMPPNLIYAFVSLEDKRFFEHHGVDWLRTLAAAKNFIIPTASTYGGSTITQQLVKMMTGNDEHTIQRKIQEMLRAMNLEKKSSKQDIMETYLNMVSLSNNCVGVQAASNLFFGKDVHDLSLIECAALAAIVQSPTAFDPVRRPENNAKRRNACLQNMYDYGYITKEQFDEAFNHDLVLNITTNGPVDTLTSYYTDQIINDVTADLMAKNPTYTKAMAQNLIFSGGLRIYTCMDKTVQDIMEGVYNDPANFPEQPEGATLIQSAMVVLDPTNGDLLGIVGGRGEKVQRGLNRASQSKRQPGSSIKPVSVYAPAFERGIINWGSIMTDEPITLNGKSWPPNLPAGYEGKISLQHALAVSKNTVAVRLMQQLDPKTIFPYMHDELNMTSLIEQEVKPDGTVFSDVDLAPLALGAPTYGVTVMELVGAYDMIADKGIYSKP